MANAGKKMGAGATGQHGAKPAGKTEPGELPDEFTYADEIHGRNSLQGNDQRNVRNQRQAQAGAKGQTEDVIESFEKSERHKKSKE
ncbi:hypothetical protein V6617_02045 [Pelagibacterium nitratireducens]|uniref:Uncharacterized protein n=1 Tax=Pelagibacterium nitratireducens TaxID=1046114 RepID=A0ABZ2I0A2_9HYPH